MARVCTRVQENRLLSCPFPSSLCPLFLSFSPGTIIAIADGKSKKLSSYFASLEISSNRRFTLFLFLLFSFFFYYRTKNPFDWNVLFAGTFEMKSRTATFLLSRLFFKVARPVDIDYHSRIESLTGNNRRMELTSSLLPFLFFNSLFLSFSLFLFNPLSIPIMRKRSFKTHQEWIRDCRY